MFKCLYIFNFIFQLSFKSPTANDFSIKALPVYYIMRMNQNMFMGKNVQMHKNDETELLFIGTLY